ncbi:MAG: acetate--CoA ligase family protein, partial [Candidatus Zixiibacteriota bacterium]
ASATSRTIGRQILHNIVSHEFRGKVFPVNPKADVINSIKAYPSVLEIPDEVDLAMIVVPRHRVPKVTEECGQKGVKGLVVISAGFKEAGGVGAKLEKQTLEIARNYGMRMVGPNCFGIVNTEPAVRMNATFGKTNPGRGNIAFVTQSGALGEAIMVHAQELNVGFSMIASVGNKADISSNDLLEYWSEDPCTEIILMYIENFGNPQKFIKIAGELARHKPIVAVKSGRTKQGARAASSHTGALAGLDVGVDAFFEQTGVIRVDTVEQLFDVAASLSNQPVPKGRRVAIATNAGGPAILAVDALVSQGVRTPRLSEKTAKKLSAALPKDANISNPLDLIAGAGPAEFKKALRILKSDRNYDAIVPIFVPPITVSPAEVSRAIVTGVSGSKKPTLACFMGVRSDSSGVKILKENNIPVYEFPEAIGKTLERLAWYHEWTQKPCGTMPAYKVDSARVESIVNRARKTKRGEIVGKEALGILGAYGIPISGYCAAGSAEEAIEVAERMGYPLVMKINTPMILHKTEVGGVKVDLRTSKEVRVAFEKMRARVKKSGAKGAFSVALQKLIKGGVETVIGMTVDPTYGPLIMFGLGGVFVEVMKDVSFRVCPVSDVTAEEMVKSIKSYPMLAGFRGAKPVNLQALIDSILRLSQLAEDFNCFTEIDINPFIVTSREGESLAVDARFLIRE